MEYAAEALIQGPNFVYYYLYFLKIEWNLVNGFVLEQPLNHLNNKENIYNYILEYAASIAVIYTVYIVS